MGSLNKTRNEDSEAHLIGIYEIGKVLGATFDLDRALHDVLNILSSYLEMRHGVVTLDDGAVVAHEGAVVEGGGLSRADALAVAFWAGVNAAWLTGG